jgi:hypothetical protein
MTENKKNVIRYNYFSHISNGRTTKDTQQDNSFIGSFKTRNNSKIMVSEVTDQKTCKANKNTSIDLKNNFRVVTPVTQHKDNKLEEYLKTNFTKLNNSKIKKFSKPKIKADSSFVNYLKHSKKGEEQGPINSTKEDLNKSSNNTNPRQRPVSTDKYQHTRNSLNTSMIVSDKNSQNNSYLFKSEEELTERTQEKIKVNFFY